MSDATIKALNQIARAQGALWKLTQRAMKEDKSDGIRLTKLTEEHRDSYFKIKEELSEIYGFTEQDMDAADRLAGENFLNNT